MRGRFDRVRIQYHDFGSFRGPTRIVVTAKKPIREGETPGSMHSRRRWRDDVIVECTGDFPGLERSDLRPIADGIVKKR